MGLCGCCVKLTKHACCIGWRLFCWIISSVFLLIVIAVLFVIFWLRVPSVTLKNVNPSSQLATSVGISGPIAAFSVPVAVDLSVQNDNFFDLQFDEISISGTSSKYSSGNSPVMTGTVGTASNKVTISRHATTDLVINSTVSYDPAKDPDSSWATYLQAQCSGASGSRAINVDLSVALHFTMLSWTKQAVSVATGISFNC